jgi:acyl carrier protein
VSGQSQGDGACTGRRTLVVQPERGRGSIVMEDVNAVKDRIKTMMVENLMLQVNAAEIADDQPLFGPGSLGLDSVDALQLVVALDKSFGLKVADPAAAKEVLQSVNTMAAAVERLKAKG